MIVHGKCQARTCEAHRRWPRDCPTGVGIDGWRQSARTSARLRGRWTAPVGRIAARGYWRPVLRPQPVR